MARRGYEAFVVLPPAWRGEPLMRWDRVELSGGSFRSAAVLPEITAPPEGQRHRRGTTRHLSAWPAVLICEPACILRTNRPASVQSPVFSSGQRRACVPQWELLLAAGQWQLSRAAELAKLIITPGAE